jgi:hypothetical protein
MVPDNLFVNEPKLVFMLTDSSGIISVRTSPCPTMLISADFAV